MQSGINKNTHRQKCKVPMGKHNSSTLSKQTKSSCLTLYKQQLY